MKKIEVTAVAGPPSGHYDLIVASLGYETRATFIAKRYTGKDTEGIALSFKQRLVGAFQANSDAYRALGYRVIPYDVDSISATFAEAVRGVLKRREGPSRLLVDISSMSRPMIATVAHCLSAIADEGDLDVTFTYCPATYSPPPATRGPVTISEPVIPELAGWSVEPERSVAAIVGLGFEHDLALGAVEFLEPAAAWVFVPMGEDSSFDKAVKVANQDLLEALQEEFVVPYDVLDPYGCFVQLEALTYGLLSDRRPILVPFGPKLFALMCVLIGIIHSPHVSVWRVSGDQSDVPEDRVPSGTIVSLQASFLSQTQTSV